MRPVIGSATKNTVQSASRVSAVRKALMGTSALMVAITWCDAAFAQTTLPPLTVQTKKARPKAAAKAAPKQAPTPSEPPAEVAAEPLLVAPQDVPYTTPSATSTATRSDLDTFGQIGTSDILRSMPGVGTRESPGNAGTAVNIRGMEGSGRVNMMIDGVRQNFRFTGHEAQGFAYVDPNLLAGIDVNRGAVSTQGGSGALAGTANFRTLDVDDFIKPGRDAGVLTTATWGSNGVGWSEMAGAGVRTETIGIAGAISGHNQGNYKNGDGITVLNTDRDIISGLFKVEIKPSTEHFLKFGGVIYDADFTANSYFQNLRSDTFTMNYIYRPVDNPLVYFKFNAYTNDVKMQYFAGVNASAALGRVVETKGKGFDVSNTSKFWLGGIKVISEYGFEYFGDEFEVTNSTAAPDRGVNGPGESSTAGLFSQTKFSYGIADLIVGLRYDMFTLKGSGSVAPGNPVGLPPGPYEVDREDERFNPKVTFALNPTPWLQPYVTYSESMRYPTVNETFVGGSHPGSGTPPQFFYPNPFLEPEIAKGWEFGFNIKKDGLFARNDSFRFKATYFMLDVENYITASFVGGTHFINNPGISKVDGVELQGMYDARYVFAGMSYTYSNSDLPPQANGFGAQSYLPEHVLSITAGLRFFDEKLTVGARGYFASKAYTGGDLIPTNGDPYTPGYELLDLFASYKFDSGLQLGASVTNVFDEAYTPYTATPATGFTGDTGRGRTVLLTAKAQF